MNKQELEKDLNAEQAAQANASAAPEPHWLEISEAVVNVFNVQLPRMREEYSRQGDRIEALQSELETAKITRGSLGNHINDVEKLVKYAEANKEMANRQ